MTHKSRKDGHGLRGFLKQDFCISSSTLLLSLVTSQVGSWIVWLCMFSMVIEGPFIRKSTFFRGRVTYGSLTNLPIHHHLTCETVAKVVEPIQTNNDICKCLEEGKMDYLVS